MDMVSNRGLQFVSKFWQEFCKLLGATVSLSSGFHPQSNGQIEKANQDLERVLRYLVSKNPSSWSQQLSMLEYTHNVLPVSSMSLSPFECSLGYQPPIFPSLESEVAVPSDHITSCNQSPHPILTIALSPLSDRCLSPVSAFQACAPVFQFRVLCGCCSVFLDYYHVSLVHFTTAPAVWI